MKKITKQTTPFATSLLIMLFALNNGQLLAQKAPHEFSVYADGGVSTYCFQPRIKGSLSLGYSSDFGVGFSGFFGQRFGIHTSAGFGLLNVKSTLDLYHLTPNRTDENGETFDLHTTLVGYTEIHKTMFVTIPVMLHFQTRQRQYWNWSKTQKAGFYAMGGVKVHFLFNNKYEASVGTLSNAGYYPEYDNWAATQLFSEPEFGEYHFNGAPVAGKLDFGVMVLFACEAGVKWRIDNNIFVYTGAFFDCALNDPIRDSRQPYELFTKRKQFDNLTLLNFSNRTNLMVAGIKVRFAFSRNQRHY
jgi:hypothetical protein